jgi:hypothetical protein
MNPRLKHLGLSLLRHGAGMPGTSESAQGALPGRMTQGGTSLPDVIQNDRAPRDGPHTRRPRRLNRGTELGTAPGVAWTVTVIRHCRCLSHRLRIVCQIWAKAAEVGPFPTRAEAPGRPPVNGRFL